MHELYYDIIHQDKDYDGEINFFLKSLGSSENIKDSIFEIGCGTGNHSVLLSQKFSKIYAIECNPVMLSILRKKIARLKINNINIVQSDFLELIHASLPLLKFGCAFFNVVNYILSPEKFAIFFTKIYQILDNNGDFLFDCWNENKIKELQLRTKKVYYHDNIILERITESIYNKETSILQTKEFYKNMLTKESFENESLYRLWKMDEVLEIINASGLHLSSVNPKVGRAENWIKLIKR